MTSDITPRANLGDRSSPPIFSNTEPPSPTPVQPRSGSDLAPRTLHCVSLRALGGMQRITPMFWFHNQADEAANFYVSVFKNSKVKQITHYAGEEFSEKKGQVMTASFELNRQAF